MTVRPLPVESSYATLSTGSTLARTPRLPGRHRPQAFYDAFDSRTVFYDCFWHDDGEAILLVGPPALNLASELKRVRFVAAPSGATVRARFHPSLSTMITELSGAPAGTTAIRFSIGGEHFELPVQPSDTRELAGRRILFSINRDNELAWIREWAEFHARVHGTDAVILFDNGSARYGTGDVDAVLREVPGLTHVGVLSWPHRFGPIDPAVKVNPFWPRFLQIGSMSVVLRRYGMRAAGLLDCDIDELAGTRSGVSIYDLARRSRGGLVAFQGEWVEAVPAGGLRHRDFRLSHRDREAARSQNRKWALDPSRGWVRKLSVHPYWHWIEGRPFWAKAMPRDAFYLHYKAISTNWKQQRTEAPAGELVSQPLADVLMERAGW
jgi:hypothetical protein